jgi:hypothetical protein
MLKTKIIKNGKIIEVDILEEISKTANKILAEYDIKTISDETYNKYIKEGYIIETILPDIFKDDVENYIKNPSLEIEKINNNFINFNLKYNKGTYKKMNYNNNYNKQKPNNHVFITKNIENKNKKDITNILKELNIQNNFIFFSKKKYFKYQNKNINIFIKESIENTLKYNNKTFIKINNIQEFNNFINQIVEEFSYSKENVEMLKETHYIICDDNIVNNLEETKELAYAISYLRGRNILFIFLNFDNLTVHKALENKQHLIANLVQL